MARTGNVHFDPTTASFGELTLHSTRKRKQHFFSGHASTFERSPAQKRWQNGIIATSCLALILITAGSLFAIDQALFTKSDLQTHSHYGVPLDYD